MAFPETDMEMVCRHVEQGERHIREQRKRIARLREIGVDIELAEEVLQIMLALQVEHRLHLARLLSVGHTSI